MEARPLADADAELRERTLRLANRIRDCDPSTLSSERLKPMLPFGTSVNAAHRLEQLVGFKWWRRRFKRRYTERVHDRFVAILSELKHRELRDAHLEHFIMDRPTPKQCGDVAATLWHLGEKLPGGGRHGEGPDPWTMRA
jgi:hypothetical protein